jgi:hypothetical protein
MSSVADRRIDYKHRRREQQRLNRERSLQGGVCRRSGCGRPRGEDGTKDYCRSCADFAAQSAADSRKRKLDAGLCLTCGEPRGEGGTREHCRRHADEQNVRKRERSERLINSGLCRICGEPRGEDGTKNYCRRHADKYSGRHSARYQRLRDEGLCVWCGEPRGEDGTETLCRPHADAIAANDRELYQRLIQEGLCPVHRESLRLLGRCPACRYEADAGASLSEFSFAGLLPPPDSEDRLETCAGCENCGRAYHRGHLYYLPHIPPDLKLRDEHVGEDGAGLWLRFSHEDEHGRVPIDYEACSLPDETCTERAPKKRALDFLRRYRTGARLSGACKAHLQDHERRRQATVARVRNGSTPQGGASVKRSVGRPPKSEELKLREARKLLGRIREMILRLKAEGIERESVTGGLVAERLNIGGEAGGDLMMKQLKRGGIKIRWAKLRGCIWDDSTEIKQFLSSDSTEMLRVNK